MSGSTVGGIVGGIVGFWFGMPQLGYMIGSMIGGAVDPDEIRAPSIGDAQRQTSQAGMPRPVVYGHPAPFAGNVIDGDPIARKIEVEEEQGKGGPVVISERFLLTTAVRICEGPIEGVVRIWRNGEVVLDLRTDDQIPEMDGGESARREYINDIRARSAKFLKSARIYLGTEDQLPDPALEAIHGVGNTPYYRGTAYLLVEDDDVTDTRGASAQFMFEVTGTAVRESIVEVLPTVNTGWNQNIYHAEGVHGDTEIVPIESDAALVISLSGASFAYAIRYFLAPLYAEPDPSIQTHSLSAIEGMTGTYDSGWWAVDETSRAAMEEVFISQGLPVPGISIGTPPDITMTFPQPVKGLLLGKAYLGEGGPGHTTGTMDIRFGDASGNFRASPDIPGVLIGDDGKLYVLPGSSLALEEITSEGISLASVVEDIMGRCGVPSNRIDVTSLAPIFVPGFLVAEQHPGSDTLLPTQQAFFYDLPEFDNAIRAVLRGREIAVSISGDDLLDDHEEETRPQQVEYPLKLSVVSRHPEADYSPIPQTSQRLANDFRGVGEATIAIAIPFNADQAMQIASKAHKVLAARSEGRVALTLPDSYTPFIPSDCFEYVGKRWMIEKVEWQDGEVRWEAVYDRVSSYRSTARGARPLPPVIPDVNLLQASHVVVLPIRQFRPEDVSPGVYVAVTANPGKWPGATIQLSVDGQKSWSTVGTTLRRDTVGRLVESIGPGTEPIEVRVNGNLYSIDDDSFDLNGNLFALVGSTAEVAKFKTATDVGDTYELTDVQRGLNGTSGKSWPEATEFVMLERVLFVPLSEDMAGRRLWMRAVTFGTDPDTAEHVPFEFSVYTPPTTFDTRVDVDGNVRVDAQGNTRITING